MQSDCDLLYKLCIIGDSGVGKSCILLRFADDKYSDKFESTVGVDFRTKTIEDEGKVVKLHMWDTAGQERFRSVAATTFRGAHGIIYVFDITDKESFEGIRTTWIDEVAKHEGGGGSKGSSSNVVSLLVGSKCDLSSKRVVSYQEAEAFATSIGAPYIETSAKNDLNIASAFKLMVAAIREKERSAPPLVNGGDRDKKIDLASSKDLIPPEKRKKKLPCC